MSNVVEGKVKRERGMLRGREGINYKNVSILFRNFGWGKKMVAEKVRKVNLKKSCYFLTKQKN